MVSEQLRFSSADRAVASGTEAAPNACFVSGPAQRRPRCADVPAAIPRERQGGICCSLRVNARAANDMGRCPPRGSGSVVFNIRRSVPLVVPISPFPPTSPPGGGGLYKCPPFHGPLHRLY